MKLKPYPVCSDSVVPWLGKVPEHWQIYPNRVLFTEIKERNHPDADMLSVTITKGVIRQQALLEDSSKKDSSKLDRTAYKFVLPGDIAYNKMRAWQGAIGVSEYEGIISPAYVVQRPREGVVSRYMHYLFRTPAFTKEAERWSYGITSDMWSLRPEHFKLIYSCLPKISEQAAIVKYLDCVDRRIRRYIWAKQKLIKLLEEQKQAIIYRAVTRGLDPSVPLKPSGILWLGDIPQHWEVRRLRHLIKGRLTYGANVAAEFTNSDWPRYIRITDFRTDGSLKPDTFRSLPPVAAEDYMVDPGDILFARSGATVGKAFLVLDLTGAACHAGYLIRARPDRSLVHPEFLFAFTQSKAFSAWKDSTFNTATIQNIGADKYANLPVPLPSLPEQQAILEFVTIQQRPLLATISRLEREIKLLREYRTRLVADVVTGKLDVREVAARLPKDEDESETLDEVEVGNDAEEALS